MGVMVCKTIMHYKVDELARHFRMSFWQLVIFADLRWLSNEFVTLHRYETIRLCSTFPNRSHVGKASWALPWWIYVLCWKWVSNWKRQGKHYRSAGDRRAAIPQKHSPSSTLFSQQCFLCSIGSSTISMCKLWRSICCDGSCGRKQNPRN